jgi:phenylacetate-coenzyme A ligase PaaK-like adenylate-forming protein
VNIGITWKVLRAAGDLARHEQWTRPRLELAQATQLRHLREFAYARSPFYQKFHRGKMDRPLSDLPVLTKSQLMEDFDELVTDRAVRLDAVRAHLDGDGAGRRYLGRYWVNATSGSSGQPGIFLFDEDEWIRVLASFARAHEWAGVGVNLTHRMRMASVASVSPWHMSSQVGATLRSWWMPALRLAASEPIGETVSWLNGWQPEMLVAYASMARVLADEQLAGRLNIHPHLVFTSSEVLTGETRRRAEQAWGQSPLDQYGATEVGDLAAEHSACRHMHTFDDLVIIEVVDERHRPVPAGEYGAKLLVTSLFSRTQPLIRYELNDSVRLGAAQDSCGLPFAIVDGIQGRTEDVLSLPTAAGDSVDIQPLVFHRILDLLPVSGWQVTQDAPDRLTVLLSGSSDGIPERALAQRMRQALAAEGVGDLQVSILKIAVIPKNASGKSPLIKAYRHQAVTSRTG